MVGKYEYVPRESTIRRFEAPRMHTGTIYRSLSDQIVDIFLDAFNFLHKV